jgi:hypothetical protein
MCKPLNSEKNAEISDIAGIQFSILTKSQARLPTSLLRWPLAVERETLAQ